MAINPVKPYIIYLFILSIYLFNYTFGGRNLLSKSILLACLIATLKFGRSILSGSFYASLEVTEQITIAKNPCQ